MVTLNLYRGSAYYFKLCLNTTYFVTYLISLMLCYSIALVQRNAHFWEVLKKIIDYSFLCLYIYVLWSVFFFNFRLQTRKSLNLECANKVLTKVNTEKSGVNTDLEILILNCCRHSQLCITYTYLCNFSNNLFIRVRLQCIQKKKKQFIDNCDIMC